MRIDPQVVVAQSLGPDPEVVERRLLACEPLLVVRGSVRTVQPDLRVHARECLDEARPESLVRLGRRAVVHVAVPAEDIERRASCTSASLLGDDLLEPPVRIRAA